MPFSFQANIWLERLVELVAFITYKRPWKAVVFCEERGIDRGPNRIIDQRRLTLNPSRSLIAGRRWHAYFSALHFYKIAYSDRCLSLITTYNIERQFFGSLSGRPHTASTFLFFSIFNEFPQDVISRASLEERRATIFCRSDSVHVWERTNILVTSFIKLHVLFFKPVHFV